MENLKDLSMADLDSLHRQLMKEEGYADSSRQPQLAERIAQVTNEKNSRLHGVFGEGSLNANVSGGIVPGEYNNDVAAVSAETLAHPDEAAKSDKLGGVGVEPDKQQGSAKK